MPDVGHAPDSGSRAKLTAIEASLVVLGLFFLAQWFAIRVAGPHGPQTWRVWLAGSLGPPLVLLAGALVVAWRYRPLVRGLRPPLRSLWWVIAGVGLGAAGGSAVGPTRPEDLAPLLGPLAQMAWALLWVGLVAPVVEELFFRGVLQASVARSLNAPLAVLLAAFAFGVSHLGLQPLWLWPLLGVLFGTLAAVSGSLWPAVAAHVGWNLATVVASLSLRTTNEVAAVAFCVGLVCLMAGIIERLSGRRPL